MSNNIPASNPLGYLGLKERNPPDFAVNIDRDPTSDDYRNVDIGDLWRNKDTSTFFILANKVGAVATWYQIAPNLASDEFIVDTSSGTGTNPVLPDGSGQITMTGGQVAAATTANAIQIASTAANTIDVQVQRSSAAAAANADLNGVCHFDSASFSVDADGFVSLTGGGAAVDSLVPDTSSAPGTSPVLPDGSGQITITGAQVATGTIGANVIRTASLAANSLTVQIQRSTAAAATDSSLNGVCHFDSASFSVDANGFVTIAPTAGYVVGPGATVADGGVAVYDGLSGYIIRGCPMIVATNGSVTNASSVAGQKIYQYQNTNNAGGNTAVFQVMNGGSSGGDVVYRALVASNPGFAWGIDASSNFDFKISSSLSLGTSDVMHIYTTGEVAMPLQTAFLAYLSATVTNVTGTGTVYTIIFNTEVFDQNSDFNLGTSTFTAPVDGRYNLNGRATITGTTVVTAVEIFLTTSNREYRSYKQFPALAGSFTVEVQDLCDMDAGDTAVLKIQSTGEAGDTDDVLGAAQLYTSFSGNLEC